MSDVNETNMREKSKMPQIGEALFCIVYLIFGYVAGIAMIIHAGESEVNGLLGALTLILAGGDSFHLIPRIINAFAKKFDNYEFWAGLGLMVSSITMTIFYILLYYSCELIAEPDKVTDTVERFFYVLVVFSVIRIVSCLFPQNNWFHKEGNQKWSIIRNIPFIIVGIIAVWVSFVVGQTGMAIAIIISFGCYLPVVLWAKKKPMIGMLMIPKTIAYMWIICIALKIVF